MQLRTWQWPGGRSRHFASSRVEDNVDYRLSTRSVLDFILKKLLECVRVFKLLMQLSDIHLGFKV